MCSCRLGKWADRSLVELEKCRVLELGRSNALPQSMLGAVTLELCLALKDLVVPKAPGWM